LNINLENRWKELLKILFNQWKRENKHADSEGKKTLATMFVQPITDQLLFKENGQLSKIRFKNLIWRK